ncbi:MSHA biogenesis protein MshC [Enterovibrio norvegicus FF-33]|uniref:MSHA biogenesis protein MshC n=1 Tax=Enterovibrio norvegicus FF-454 TaxID=1185651 RepID=A0A1E5BXG3_9GAMM|nr:prepilin-type N-terminal cleavage/methylation domain-containing protein [Enterovibrio norvegicus]OEE57974.1 MSHA biogenesis protein MshC [Enterovibrio norvegicus FF-454]OEE70613.1 MSHA biogenesis protein MshC [Enterovibrio norvegicus FF-33]OEE82442.1 MSHA biogenesis protein MshC [Enterovibrio norvegicus FF-162]
MKGFTLIELITVLVILGIISVFAVPRLSGSEAFSVIGARDAGLSVARQVQLRAMQQETPSADCHTLSSTATRMGGSAASGCGFKTDRSDVVDLSDSSVRVSPAQTYRFDLLGRRVNNDGKRLCISSVCKITFSQGSSSASICLNSEGYFYACR